MSPPTRPPHALLTIDLVLSAHSSRATLTWEWRACSGMKVRTRRRYSRLVVGVEDVRHVSDSEQVLVFLDALAMAIALEDDGEAPAPPGGGVTGGEQLTFDLTPGGIDETVYDQING